MRVINYIAITGSASLQDTHLLGEFGGTGNALKAGPRKQPGPATRSGLLSRTGFFLIPVSWCCPLKLLFMSFIKRQGMAD